MEYEHWRAVAKYVTFQQRQTLWAGSSTSVRNVDELMHASEGAYALARAEGTGSEEQMVANWWKEKLSDLAVSCLNAGRKAQ